MNRKVILCQQALWLLFACSMLIFALGISWQINKHANFLYGYWYQVLAIETVVSKHVPVNSQGKKDFPVNNANLAEKMFADIVTAIHQSGRGLAEISYRNDKGLTGKFLTNSEVIHLQDVANLIDGLTSLWRFNLLILVLLLTAYIKTAIASNIKNSGNDNQAINSLWRMPSGKQKFVTLLVVVALITIILMTWGFTQVFYYLHTVVFPEQHQWFFYYQDSLMAAIMKAPDIFAVIAAQLLMVGMVLILALDFAVSRWQKSIAKTKR
ncbi:Protein of unknown function [Colwellia chukchiensis]|uniref:DUF1461 domain-containing protein n=1 Tax=Colwellia chukchiensis TaxID=641665 RepID=A0A1H7NT22_9GAMM|nr:DUF1461 domain-containing protein [Colwellia chukchiensis]SEL26713.1 Protein of unknown function [Colwellia chukchiensis]